jgi:hypothetical protein
VGERNPDRVVAERPLLHEGHPAMRIDHTVVTTVRPERLETSTVFYRHAIPRRLPRAVAL